MLLLKLLQIFTSFVSDALSNKKNILFSRIVADQFILFRPYENIADAEARVDAINNHFMDYVTKQYPFLKLRLRSGIYHVTTECKTAAEAIDAANYARKSLLNNHQTTAALYNEALANNNFLKRSGISSLFFSMLTFEILKSAFLMKPKRHSLRSLSSTIRLSAKLSMCVLGNCCCLIQRSQMIQKRNCRVKTSSSR